MAYIDYPVDCGYRVKEIAYASNEWFKRSLYRLE
jgi:hypothetical protein